MSDDLPLEAVFFAALEKSLPQEREAYLDRICVGNSDLRRCIEKMLAAQAQAGSFLEHPATSLIATVDDPISERPGTVIGPYKLMEQIGEGGMGLVFVAEQQQPVRRKVALKVIKPGMDTRQVVARFEVERQALALMDHPNIAKVLDGGQTAEGRPYFVMELVKGVPITEYCDRNKVPIRARLELFVHVCQAVQHAHQKGIIHRDLKPSNVLVVSHDGTPVVKVIDFGVAKAIGQQLTDKSIYTQFAQMVGTPLYMSPEQAGQSGLDADTRSDIYSLGVLLYELLTGMTPFDKERLHKAGYDEMRRIICEEEPPKPSTRISTLGKVETTVSAQRHSEQKQLSRLFRGELDWIVMKALEKDRNRRYETANGLALDVQRYLADEPVLACPPSQLYRLRKFARRNKRVLTSVVAIAASLVLGLAVTIVLQATHAVEMQEEHKRTTGEFNRAETALEEAKENLNRADQNLALALESLDEVYMKDVEDRIIRDKRITEAEREALQKGLKFYERFAQQNAGHAELQRATAKANRRAGFLRLDLKDWADAQADFAKAIAVFEKWADESRGSVEDKGELARSCYGMTLGLRRTGQHREAAPVCRRAVALWEKLSADRQAPNHRVELGHCLWELGQIMSQDQQPDIAEKSMREAQQLFESLAAEYPKVLFYRQEEGHSHCELGLFYGAAGRKREETESYKKAVLVYKSLVTESPATPFFRQELAYSYHLLGGSLRESQQPQAAADAFRQSLITHEKLVVDFPANVDFQLRLASNYDALVQVLMSASQVQDAQEVLRRNMKFHEKLMAAHPDEPGFRNGLAFRQHDLALLFQKIGQEKKATEAFRQAIANWEKLAADFPTRPEYRQHVAYCYRDLAAALNNDGQLEEAEKARHVAVADLEKLEPKTVADLHARAATYKELHQYDKALADYSKAIELEPMNSTVWNTRGYFYNNLPVPQYDKALADCSKAIELNPKDAGCWVERSSAYVGRGQYDKALTNSDKAIELDPNRMWTWACRGRVYLSLHQYDKAIADSNKAIDLDSKNHWPWNIRGLGYYGLRQYDKALFDFTKAIELKPNYVAALYNRARTYWFLHQYDKALADYSKVTELEPKRAAAWNDCGACYEQLGQPEKALQDFSRAIELDPTAALYWRNRGRIHTQLGQLDKAATDYTKAIELNPKEPDTWYWRAGANSQLGRYAEALTDYQKVLELAKDAAIVHNDLAWLLATCPAAKYRNPPRAVELAKKAVELVPKEGGHWNTLGVAHYRAGNWKAAVEALNKSRELRKGGDAFDFFFLAMAHRQLGQKDEALKWYKQAFEWMEKNNEALAKNPQWMEELRRFSAEAKELLNGKE